MLCLKFLRIHSLIQHGTNNCWFHYICVNGRLAKGPEKSQLKLQWYFKTYRICIGIVEGSGYNLTFGTLYFYSSVL